MPAGADDKWSAALGRYVRHGNVVTPCFDGATAFKAIYDAIETTVGPSHFIYMTAWWLDDALPLTSDEHSTLEQLFARKAKAGVQVRVLLWLNPLHHLGGSDLPQQIKRLADLSTTPFGFAKELEAAFVQGMNGTDNTHFKVAERINKLPGAAAIVDWMTAKLWSSHHQKLLCVRGNQGVIGLCGGVDVNKDRIEEVEKGKGQPLHDVHCTVRGPAAADIVASFVQRWDAHPDGVKANQAADLLGRKVLPNDRPGAEGAMVRIVKTFNEVHSAKFNPVRNACQRERSFRDAITAAFARATRFIYLEDQYMVSEYVADLIAAALPRVQHVTAVITGSPISDFPQVWARRKTFIARATKNGALTNFRVYYLYDRKERRFGQRSYVHAKCWVVDDELAYIGSSNLNLRGLSSDSEIGLLCHDGESRALPPYGVPQGVRMELWRRHLGVSIVDPIGEESRKAWDSSNENARVMPYDPDEGRDPFLLSHLPWALIDPDVDDLPKCAYKVQTPM